MVEWLGKFLGRQRVGNERENLLFSMGEAQKERREI